jgi:glycosidase
VHRPRADWEKYKKRTDGNTVEGRVFQGLKKLIRLRKHHKVFAGGELEIIPTENDHVLGFMRTHAGKRAIIFANFSEAPQTIPTRILEQYSVHGKKRLAGRGQSGVLEQGDGTIEALDFLVFG